MSDFRSAAVPTTAAQLGLPGQRVVAVVGVLPPPPRLAIVGSRAAFRDRMQAVGIVVEVAAERGWSIVSGGALGIDAAAHRAALRRGVPQVAVLPCGTDLPYPAVHVPLFQAIVEAGGAVVFGRPRGCAPNRAVFASRNALVVGLSTRMLVAQAALRSGSMGTGRLALSRRRPLAVFAGQPGTMALASLGAVALPFPAPPEALTEATSAWLSDQRLTSVAWPADLQRVHAAIAGAGPRGLSIDTLDPSLTLELVRAQASGFAGELTPGRYVALR